jgi:hypothetical protein
MRGQSYQDLVGWQKSMALVSEIYRHTQNFPANEIYGLTSQIRRAAVCVPSALPKGKVGSRQESSNNSWDMPVVQCLKLRLSCGSHTTSDT